MSKGIAILYALAELFQLIAGFFRGQAEARSRRELERALFKVRKDADTTDLNRRYNPPDDGVRNESSGG